jgi:hypothetical protein
LFILLKLTLQDFQDDDPFWEARPKAKEKEPKGRKPNKKAGSRGGRKKKETINPLDVDPSILESSKDESSASS